MKSPIIYYGGKSSMLPHIRKIRPEHKVYTEVFFGGGAEFFDKEPTTNETINDKLDIVVNFYEQLRKNFKELKALIMSTLISRTQYDKAMLMIKNKQLFSSVELAWAFWMCCNFSYGNKIGGGIKFSNQQWTEVPKILNKKKNEFIELLVNRIENTHIENRDAVKVLNSRNTPEAYHFIDPPYINADQGHYKGYDLYEYKSLLNFCGSCKGKFILCGYMSDVLQQHIEHYGWNHEAFTFNNKGMRKKDKSKHEILTWNFTAEIKPDLFTIQNN